jgi:hypothetical protein
VKRVFKWAAAEEFVPITVYQALRTLAGLRKGRTEARESEPVKPVDLAHVNATLRKHASRGRRNRSDGGERLHRTETSRGPGDRAHQLTPELAADIADARLVVFVDATVGREPVRAARLDCSGRTANGQNRYWNAIWMRELSPFWPSLFFRNP